jgi:DNA-directed RNA polymerase sigma subunit (sigma70/sigma32)
MAKQNMEKFLFSDKELHELRERERVILARLFGLPSYRLGRTHTYGRFVPPEKRETLIEVARLMGMTVERVAKIRDQALLCLAQNRWSRHEKSSQS